MSRKSLSTIAVVLLALAAQVGLAAPAEAATKTVTITMGDWNCRQGGKYSGKITKVLIDVVPGNNPAARWISGKSRTVNVIYTPSGSRVTIAAVVFCKTSWWGGGYYREISAGRWVSRDTGTSWNV